MLNSNFLINKDLINIKYLLINASTEYILKNCDMSDFLAALNSLITFEQEFLWLDPLFVKEIETILTEYRFNTTKESIIVEINKITLTINKLKNSKEKLKQEKVENYILKQEDMRQITFKDLEDFINTLGNDSIILYGLNNNQTNLCEEPIFFGAINYFLKVMPELFEDKKILSIAKEKLKEIKSKNKKIFVKKNIRITINHLNNVNEEKK